MRQMMMPGVWIEGYRAEPASPANRSEDLWNTIWRYCWPLLFVIAMTLLSMFGPRMAYSKQPPDPPMASQPVLHTVK